MNSKLINILHLEDNENDAELVQSALNSGFNNNYTRVNNEKDFLYNLRQKKFDLILSDYTIPGYDGISGLKRSRAIQPETPFLFISGTLAEESAIDMLKEGAWDYILKTHLKRLEPSIRRCLKEAVEKEEYKISQLELRKSEEQYRQIVETAQEGIWTIDENNRTNFVNKKMCELLEYTRGEMTDKQVFDFMDDEGKAIAAQLIEKQKTELEPSSVFKYLTKTGRVIWTNISSNPIFDSEGKYKGALAMVTDISKQREAETGLKRAHEKLLFYLENAPLGFIEWNTKSIPGFWSKRAEEIFGWSEKEIISEQITGLSMIYKDDLLEISKVADDLMSGKIDTAHTIHRNITKSGKVIWCEWNNSVLRNKDGSVDVILSLVQDVTERKNNEEKIKNSLNEKDTLLKEIHHRVKNNLQIISSLLKLQSASISDLKVREKFLSSLNRVKSMAIVHQKLYQSRDLSKIPFELYIRQLIGELYISYGINEDRIKTTLKAENIFFNIETSVPFGLILNELISNSLNHAFTEKTKGSILIELKQIGTDYILKYEDDGIGIPPGADNEESGSLGLHLIKTLTGQIDGEIKVTTGVGTKYEIKFRELGYKERM